MIDLFDAAFRAALALVEGGWLPDMVTRAGIRLLLSQRLSTEGSCSTEEAQKRKISFVEELKQMPIAIQTEAANEQHYELPTDFFQLCLGKRLKYSSGLYKSPTDSVDNAEDNMMALYCARAQLKDGQDVLELGCGWGSLTLFLAEVYPASKITAVTNSSVQKDFIDAQARARGFKNVEVIKANVVHFKAPGTYDRVLSVEMFEHMKNYQELLRRISQWLKDDGLLFVHIFCHKKYAYHFKVESSVDWMSRYFFSGGTMPSLDLMLYFQDDLKVRGLHYINGMSYSHTLEAWLKRMDSQGRPIKEILKSTYGDREAEKWRVYWRLFYIACSELFRYSGGEEWGIAHIVFEKPPSKQ
eukprot:evm.model.scf_1721.1 EVM.evm.TU.scf_1721.1   scf_1721:1789-7648(+)